MARGASYCFIRYPRPRLRASIGPLERRVDAREVFGAQRARGLLQTECVGEVLVARLRVIAQDQIQVPFRVEHVEPGIDPGGIAALLSVERAALCQQRLAQGFNASDPA